MSVARDARQFWKVVIVIATVSCLFKYALARAVESPAGSQAKCHSFRLKEKFHWTRISSSKWVPAHGRVPGFCEVTGVISPTAASRIGVVYRLPEHWSGRMVGFGGGGWAGNVRLNGPFGAIVGLKRGDATAQTDSGHTSTALWNTSWAMLPDAHTNWPGLEDFSYRAIHLMTVIGKQVVKRFYGVRPSRSYFDGCSTGGRQGLMEAQRFPRDYAGIIVGAPVYNELTETSMVNSGRVFGAAASKLTLTQVRLVHNAALKSCDREDGLKDGIITDPQACHWDPAPLLCRRGESRRRCLTMMQVRAVRQAYRVVRAPSGTIVAYGLSRGSELISFPIFLRWGGNVAKAVGLENVQRAQFPAPGFTFQSWNIGRQFRKMQTTRFAHMYDADNPNLEPFVARGGKLIIWQGMYDQFQRSPATGAYFRRMQKVTAARLIMHGRSGKLVSQATRLYMLPGVAHCGGGPGAGAFNRVRLIEGWVGKNRVPDRTEVYKRTKGGDVEFSRPLCPYPSLPYYSGRGNSKYAANFVCRRPED